MGQRSKWDPYTGRDFESDKSYPIRASHTSGIVSSYVVGKSRKETPLLRLYLQLGLFDGRPTSQSKSHPMFIYIGPSHEREGHPAALHSTHDLSPYWKGRR